MHLAFQNQTMGRDSSAVAADCGGDRSGASDDLVLEVVLREARSIYYRLW
jgi:hypothetical protein